MWEGTPAARTVAGHPSLAKLAQGTVCKILAEHEVKPHRIRYCLKARSQVRAQNGRNPLCLPANSDAAVSKPKAEKHGPRQRWRRVRRHRLL
jgi:hypothetical protein